MKVQASRLPSPAQMLCMVVLLCHVGSGFSAIVGDASLTIQDELSARPGLEQLIHAANAQNFNISNHYILVDDFGVGSTVEMSYKAPLKGRVRLNLIDEAEGNIVLHVDVRYDQGGTLALNTFKAGVGWLEELTLKGFDFTPWNLVTVRVRAETDKYIIYCNDHEIGQYEHRLPVTSVKKVQVIFGGCRKDELECNNGICLITMFHYFSFQLSLVY